MKTKDILLITLAIVLSLTTAKAATQENGIIHLSGNDFRNPGDSIVFDGLWKYHAGDDGSWSDPDFDDTDWELASTMIGNQALPGGWQGIGWFRLHLNVDSTLLNMPLALRLVVLGGCEVYLNGEMAMTIGKVGSSEEIEKLSIFEHGVPLIITFNQTDNVIAVRLSNFKIEEIWRMGMEPGFMLNLAEPQGYLTWLVEIAKTIKSYQMFFTAVALILALIHLLMYMFYPVSRENLYFALFALSISAMVYFPYLLSFSRYFDSYMTIVWLFKFSVFFTAITGPLFLYSLFYPRLPKTFWLILLFGIGMLIASPFITLVNFYMIVILPFIENLRIVILAVIRKITGARIIALGFATFISFCIFQMMMEMKIITPPAEFMRYSYLYGILLMLISMSVYLARNFARTSRNLEAQLVQVKELSEKTLAQERQAQKQKIEQSLLQAEVDHKEKELEEARKLEKALRELENAHTELKDTQAKLVQSEKMASLGLLVAGIAHEINTPIGAVCSMHDTLVRSLEKLKDSLEAEFSKDKDDDGSINALMQTIDEANKVINSGTVRVTDIVKRLRSFARLDEADLDTVNIHEGLDDTLTIIHHEIKHRARVIREYGDIPPISCYPGQLNQVFLNLLINAGQAIKDKGEIVIKTFQAGNRVHIEIGDNGAGIPSEIINRVFDPGFTTKGVGVGTGLGLSICYQIIQDHKGEIKVESEVGKGTVFTVILPMDLGENSIEFDK